MKAKNISHRTLTEIDKTVLMMGYISTPTHEELDNDFYEFFRSTRLKDFCHGKESIENTYVVFAVYQKYLMRMGELIIFEPWRENYHFSQSN